MEDLAEVIMSKMSPIEPVGYIVEICANDYQTVLLEAKGVVFNGNVAFMVRSAPSSEVGHAVAPKETWTSQLCPSDDSFRFLIYREQIRLEFTFHTVYVWGPDDMRHRIKMNEFGLWDESDEVNKTGLASMVGAMRTLKVPNSGLFSW